MQKKVAHDFRYDPRIMCMVGVWLTNSAYTEFTLTLYAVEKIIIQFQFSSIKCLFNDVLSEQPNG